MSGNEKMVRTEGIVVRRTNYGEADRILEMVTEVGKFAVMAKGVRREKSKLAGGVEMFCRSEVVLRCGRGEMWVLTGAKMKRFYAGVMRDLARMELAGMMGRRVAGMAEGILDGGWFGILEQGLAGLDEGMGMEMVEAWFWINLAKESGEMWNLWQEAGGGELDEGARYRWDFGVRGLVRDARGGMDAKCIKMMRIMEKWELARVAKVRGGEGVVREILEVGRGMMGKKG